VDLRHEAGLGEYDRLTDSDRDLAQRDSAALAGTAGGLRVTLNDRTTAYGLKSFARPAGGAYRFRYYLDPNSVVMPNSGQVATVQLFGEGRSLVTRLRYSTSAGYLVNVGYRDDNATWRTTATTAISDAPHMIEVLVEYASSATAGDGRVSYWVDGVLSDRDTGLDLYATSNRPNQLRLGAVWVNSPNVDGAFYLDEFALRDDGAEIGPVDGDSPPAPPPDPTPTPTPTPTSTPGQDPPTDARVSLRHERDLSEYNNLANASRLAQSSAAALEGSAGGLQVSINGQSAVYGSVDFTQVAGGTYRFRHSFDPNGVSMPNSTQIVMTQLRGSTNILMTRLRYTTSGGYEVYVIYLDDSGRWRPMSAVQVGDAPHTVEVLVEYATTASSLDGRISYWVDGTLADQDAHLDLYHVSKRPRQVRLGAVWVSNANVNGTLHLDEFALWAD
jgi:hypothetical protein